MPPLTHTISDVYFTCSYLLWSAFQMKDILHENVNVFVGACIDPPNICILWQYCSKGSLQVSEYALLGWIFCKQELTYLINEYYTENYKNRF